MKKLLIIALSVLMSISMFAACAKTEEPEEPEVQPTMISSTNDEEDVTEAEPTEEPQEEEQGYIPENVSPTTGLENTTTTYKPVIVQIENEPPARPQRGIQWADVVYETMIEGIDTRFTCIFNDVLYTEGTPEELEVGPVRSSRYYHQWIQGEWDALYVHQGGAETPNKESYIWGESAEHIKQRINAAGKNPSNANLIYRRKNTGKALEHTAYTELRADADVYNYEPKQRQSFKFYPEEAYTDEPEIEKIELSFWSKPGWVEYRYDKDSDKLIRYMSDKEFIAEETGKPLEVQNLIIQYTSVSDFPDEGGRKKIEMFGEGPAEYVIHGKHLKGTWSREDSAGAPTIFKLDNGEELTLTPGNTWIEVHPNNKTVVTTYADGTESKTN